MKYELICYCENDKFAKKAYSLIHNEPESKNLGDITLVNEKEIAEFNWMVGGSPCQDFSVAGKGKGAVWTCKNCKDDEGNDYQYNPLEVHYTKRDKCPKCNSANIEKTRSSLVVEWLRILNEKKPNVAIYENVKNLVRGHRYFFDLLIQELHEYGYNTYWKVLNAKNYGIPQNRERVYLIIIKKELDNGKFKFPKGFDNGVRLKDLLEKEVDEKYYISQEKVDKLLSQIKDNKWLNKNANYTPTENTASYPIHSQEFVRTGFMENCPTLRQRDYKDPMCVVVGNINPSGNGMNGCVYSEEGVAPTVTTNKGEGNKILQIGMLDIKGNEQVRRVYDPDGLSPTLNSMQGGNRQPKVLEDYKICEQRTDEGLRFFKDNVCGTLRTIDCCGDKRILEVKFNINPIDQSEQLEIRKDELSNSITTVQKDSMALEATPSESPNPELVGGIGEINFGKQYRQGNRVYNADKTAMCLLSQPVGNTGGNSYLYLVKEGEELKDSFIEEKYKEFIDKYGYIPEMFNPYNCSEVTDISPTTTTTQCGSTTSSATVLIKDVYYRIRKLTPLECFRLMGFEDKDFYTAQKGLNETFYKGKDRSSSQLYKMAGNSIVVDVLYYIYLELYKAMPYLFEDIKLGSFFSGIGAFEKAIIRLQKTI